MLMFLVGILSGLLQYFPKNRVILIQKLGAEKKVLWPLSPRGGGDKALMARPLREDFFLASLSDSVRLSVHRVHP